MIIIATDMDRTLLPNGMQKSDGSMAIFNDIVKKEKPKLIYVTGRNLKEVNEAMAEFHAPVPDYIVAEVGTRIFTRAGNKFVEDKNWIRVIESVTSNWNIDNFKDELAALKFIRIQGDAHQNQFKLSYYIDDLRNSELVVKEAAKIVNSISKDALVIYSVDETQRLGLLDIIPKEATKIKGLEYIRNKEKFKKEDIIYCGDSRNDILPLTFGYKAIVVRNSLNDVKSAVKKICLEKNYLDRLYIAKGHKKLNGHYVSGIIEGLIKFNLLSPDYAK